MNGKVKTKDAVDDFYLAYQVVGSVKTLSCRRYTSSLKKIILRSFPNLLLVAYSLTELLQ